MTLPGDDPRSDAQLVADLNAGDASAFDGLYYRYRDWVVAMSRRLTGNDQDALEVLQEVFAYVFAKFPGFTLSAKMTTFLYPVVKNLSIAARRKSGRLAGDPAVFEPIAAPVAPADGRAELSQVLAQLPPAQQEVVLLRFVDGLSLAEIAQALAVPEGTVKSRLHNAIAALRADEKIRAYFME